MFSVREERYKRKGNNFFEPLLFARQCVRHVLNFKMTLEDIVLGKSVEAHKGHVSCPDQASSQ